MRLIRASHNHPSARLSVATLAFLLLRPLRSVAQPPPPLSQFYYINYSPPAAIIIIIIIGILFVIIAFLTVYLHHLASTCFGINTNNTALLGGQGCPSGAARGLNQAVIQTFPTFLYSDVKTQRLGEGALECAVCLDEFEDWETLRLLPRCSHVFHSDCIQPWLSSQVTCPVCRANLEPKSFELIKPFRPPNSGINTAEPSGRVSPNINDHDLIINTGRSPEITSPPQQEITNHSGPRLSATKDRIFNGKFARSHSTDELLGENTDRFTLRLPEAVRNKLVKVGLNQAGNGEAALCPVSCPKTGFRTRSVGSTAGGKDYDCELFASVHRPARWEFPDRFDTFANVGRRDFTFEAEESV
ncbi:hypothetical protein Nepgr_033222 [Nepenthes gracilis]|uniref:RING-type E3 ubiquitin transferase n=1 Tax=Nepenthes gracilis TaxID=150966 RepID=A0AAD3Y8I3_NEPGR|nr:hypothetical protein Nepgr_033222 [Nepenthes gracilis]